MIPRPLRQLVPISVKRRIRYRNDPEARELAGLRSRPRGAPGVTELLGYSLHYLDGPMFASTYQPIFGRGIYRFDAAGPTPRILDCGANIGLATLFWKREMPQARITAFEPDPSALEALRQNLAEARATDVTVVPAAVWTGNGELALTRPDLDAGRLGSRIMQQDAAESRAPEVLVPTVRLRDYLEEPVDFLKLDIEGAETDVVVDCADRLGNVANLFVEYHGFVGRSRLVELLTAVEGAGFSVFVEQEHPAARSPFVERPDNLGMDVQLNLYCHRP